MFTQELELVTDTVKAELWDDFEGDDTIDYSWTSKEFDMFPRFYPTDIRVDSHLPDLLKEDFEAKCEIVIKAYSRENDQVFSETIDFDDEAATGGVKRIGLFTNSSSSVRKGLSFTVTINSNVIVTKVIISDSKDDLMEGGNAAA